MKTAPVMRQMGQSPDVFQQVLVHTGQHYDENMSEIFFDQLGLPKPDLYLGVGPGSHAQQTARIMQACESALVEHDPDWVFVVGDVNSTLAAALTAAKLGLNVAHVEAGLRSFDRSMPEEHNRVLTDHLAELLFTPSPDANENLWREGIPPERTHFAGNVMIDTLVRLLPRADERWEHVRATPPIGPSELAERNFLLVTLHRPNNVDDPTTLTGIVTALRRVSQAVPVVFPVHPRTRQRLAELGLQEGAEKDHRLHLVDPLAYLDFLALETRAALVVTDSGGVQEETTFLGVPCLTVRPSTERPITMSQGTNKLISSEPAALARAVEDVLAKGPGHLESRLAPDRWDGRAAERIVQVLMEADEAGPVEAGEFLHARR